MRNRLKFITIMLASFLFFAIRPASAAGCAETVQTLNRHLQGNIDESELTLALTTLNASRNTRLPDKFVTKHEAKQAGWRPGRDLWSVTALKGKSIGGDRFANREARLPRGNWREADLGYQGGHRGAKRLLFSKDGLRRVTINHYQTFIEIPECR